jgi:formylmethanofuran dehydrogenase subunit E
MEGDTMNEQSVMCIECGEYFNVQDTFRKNGGRICVQCEAVFIGRPEDEKPLVFADNQ